MFRQDIKNLAYICAAAGMQRAVIAPGSRNTPLTLAFTAQDGIECYPMTDERSAGFFALGMAQYSDQPVALICTSGSAVLNFAPAVVEAYYQHLPLIVITADRPSAWIDQADGQTIRQQNIFGNYIKASFQLPSDQSTDNTLYSDRIVAQAIDMAMQFPRGPVHLNVPLDEPLYHPLPESHSSPRVIRTLGTDVLPDNSTSAQFLQSWKKNSRRMILVGIGKGDSELNELLNTLARDSETIVIAENLTNISGDHIITTPDLFFGSLTEDEKQELHPELLITIGHSLISKQLKQYLRKYQPKEQWQLQSDLPYADTYQCLNYIVPVKAFQLMKLLTDSPKHVQIKADYNDKSDSFRRLSREIHLRSNTRAGEYFKSLPHCDIAVIRDLLPLIPTGAVLQIANSTPIRIAQLFESRADLKYFCNRGTSGIEGSVSTAAGSALVSGKETILIAGDLSFLYDSNGMWNKNLPSNLKIVVINNGGANIFRIIGDQELIKDSQSFFDADHQVNMALLISAYGLKHRRCTEASHLPLMMHNFIHEQGPSVLEVITDMDINVQTYKELFKRIK